SRPLGEHRANNSSRKRRQLNQPRRELGWLEGPARLELSWNSDEWGSGRAPMKERRGGGGNRTRCRSISPSLCPAVLYGDDRLLRLGQITSEHERRAFYL